MGEKNKISSKSFCEELKDFMKEKNITYKELSEKSGVSISYLTKILVHKITPSAKIIFDISRAIGVNSHYFREYKIGLILKRLDSNLWRLKEKHFQQLDKITSESGKVVYTNGSENLLDEQGNVVTSAVLTFSQKHAIDIEGLNQNQRRLVDLLVKRFKKDNEEIEEKTKKMQDNFLRFKELRIEYLELKLKTAETELEKKIYIDELDNIKEFINNL